MSRYSIQGLDALNRKLDKLEDFQRVMHNPLEESADLLRDWIATVPRKRAGAFTAMATPGQKRAYWAKVRANEINHTSNGYGRTGNSKAWEIDIKRSHNGIRAEIGNKKAKDYISFVQGPEQQAFHWVSGWRTTDEAIAENERKIERIFERVIKKELRR